MYAKITHQGTAAAETALCNECVRDVFIQKTVPVAKDVTGDWVDCSNNEALQCQYCGVEVAEGRT